jgi:hypothetical protein
MSADTPSVPDTAVAADAHAEARLDEQPVAIEDETGGCLAAVDGEAFAVAIFVTGDVTEGELHEAVAATYRQLSNHLHASGRLGGDRR